MTLDMGGHGSVAQKKGPRRGDEVIKWVLQLLSHTLHIMSDIRHAQGLAFVAHNYWDWPAQTGSMRTGAPRLARDVCAWSSAVGSLARRISYSTLNYRIMCVYMHFISITQRTSFFFFAYSILHFLMCMPSTKRPKLIYDFQIFFLTFLLICSIWPQKELRFGIYEVKFYRLWLYIFF